MNDIVEQGRHLAEMLDRENWGEHLALFLMLMACNNDLISCMSEIPTQSGDSLTKGAQQTGSKH